MKKLLIGILVLGALNVSAQRLTILDNLQKVNYQNKYEFIPKGYGLKLEDSGYLKYSNGTDSLTLKFLENKLHSVTIYNPTNAGNAYAYRFAPYLIGNEWVYMYIEKGEVIMQKVQRNGTLSWIFFAKNKF